MKKIMYLFLLAFALLLKKYNCFASDREEDKRIIYLKLGIHQNLNSYKNFYLNDNLVAHLLYAYLVKQNYEGKIVLDCASFCEISQDMRVYTFKIRPDAKWQDGSRLTAYDFEKTFKYMIDPKRNNSQIFAFLCIKNGVEIHAGKKDPEELGVVALNESTLQITLAYNNPCFLGLLARGGHAVKAEVLEKYGEKWADLDKMISSGPFVLNVKKYNAANWVEFVKNENFFNKKIINADKIILRSISCDKEKEAFVGGYVDIVQEMSMMGDSWYDDPMLQKYVKQSKNAGIRYLEVNFKNDEVRNQRNLREAVYYSVDREALNRNLIRCDKPLYGLTSDFNEDFGYELIEPKKFANYEEQKAHVKNLMRDVHLKHGEIVILYSIFKWGCPGFLKINDSMVMILKLMMEAALGVRVRIEHVDGANFRRARLTRADHHFVFVTHILDLPALHMCASLFSQNQNNMGGLKNPLIEMLFERAKKSTSKQGYIDCYNKISEEIIGNFLLIPLTKFPNLVLSRVKSFKPGACSYVCNLY